MIGYMFTNTPPRLRCICGSWYCGPRVCRFEEKK
jgi:hypothetical protein